MLSASPEARPEFKVARDIEDMEAKADEALRQIEEKKYDMELRNDGYKCVSCYGISLRVNTAASSISSFCLTAHSTPRPRFP
mgnify:CR=1 FL=1